MFSSPIAILYGVRLFPIIEMFLYILSLVRNEHLISAPIHTYLCLPFVSPILSKIVFPSYIDLSKAPHIVVISHTSLLPKYVLKGITQNTFFRHLTYLQVFVH